MFGKVNQVMAEDDLHHDRGNFSYQCGFQMLFGGQAAQDSHCREQNVRGIGDGSGKSHVFDTAVFIQLGQHMLSLNEFAGFLPEKDSAQMEAQLDAQNFSAPGNKKPRDQAEQGAVDRQERNSRNAQHVAENQEKNADCKAAVAEGGNVVGQALHISCEQQVHHPGIQLRTVGLGPESGAHQENDKSKEDQDLFIVVNHCVIL